MNGLLYKQAENTAGLFMQRLSCGHYSELKQFFYSEEEADTSIANLKTDCPVFYLMTVESIKRENDFLNASFFAVCISIQNDMQTISGKQFEFCFSNHSAPYPGTLLIHRLSCKPLLSLCSEPGAMVLDNGENAFFYQNALSADQAFACSLADYIQAQELLGQKAHKEILKTRDDFSFFYNPYIYRTNEGISVKGFRLQFLRSEAPDEYQLKLSLFSVLVNWGEWKEEQIPLAELALPLTNPMIPSQAAEMIRRKLASPLAVKGNVTLLPEDYLCIQRKAALWTKGIRSCDPSLFIKEALDRDADDLLCDVMMPKVGYEGFQEQFDMMTRMKKLQPKKQGVHTLCSPYLVPVSEDTVIAYYLDFGWTMMGEAFGNEGDICPAMPDIGRYIFKLRKKQDQWKVFEVNWGPVIQYGMWRYDQTTGWLS